jgi:hypothetical protein
VLGILIRSLALGLGILVRSLGLGLGLGILTIIQLTLPLTLKDSCIIHYIIVYDSYEKRPIRVKVGRIGGEGSS